MCDEGFSIGNWGGAAGGAARGGTQTTNTLTGDIRRFLDQVKNIKLPLPAKPVDSGLQSCAADGAWNATAAGELVSKVCSSVMDEVAGDAWEGQASRQCGADAKWLPTVTSRCTLRSVRLATAKAAADAVAAAAPTSDMHAQHVDGAQRTTAVDETNMLLLGAFVVLLVVALK